MEEEEKKNWKVSSIKNECGLCYGVFILKNKTADRTINYSLTNHCTNSECHNLTLLMTDD